MSKRRFSKWHGAGNDYIFLELGDTEHDRALLARGPELAVRWSHRHRGIGADGLVLLRNDPEADLALCMFNADGSRGGVCGNALRCVARGLDLGHFGAGPTVPRRGLLRSDAGLHRVRAEAGAWRVELGRPRFAAEDIPLDPRHAEVFQGGGDSPFQLGLEAGGEAWEGLALGLGNPHLVLPLVHSPRDLDLEELAPPLKTHPAFPEGVNLSFVFVDEDGTLEQRTHERGSGETLACGSGAVAAVVALGHLLDWDRGVQRAVRMPGGTLEVTWDEDGTTWLGGPAERVYAGEIDVG